jgi:predicted anti-sigma-YlaC factor YlaD
MHQTIQDGLEDFLAGTAGREDRVRIEEHLRDCSGCRQEVDSMKEMSALFASLRSPDAPQPSPGFYARVASRIEEQRPPEPFWAALFEPVFGRRLALASLLMLATLGTVLMSRETEYAAGPSPEMILAVERDATPLQYTPLMDRDQMLFTLASHKQ